MVALVLILFPVLALAQDPGGLVTNPEATQPVLSAAVAPGNADPAGLGQQPPAPPAAIVPAPQRRGSMVGYIDDAVVGTKVRLRFESAFHDHAPDRAEFFYAKCGCYRDAGLDPNAPGPAPGIVTDLNFQQLYLQVEYGKQRWSVFGELPTRWIQSQTPGTFPNQSGIGDVRVGGKVALLSKVDQLATVQVQVYLPSGSAGDGLGTNHTSIEPALLLYNSLTDRLVIESQIGWWHPIGGSSSAGTSVPSAGDKFAGDVIFYGIGPSFEAYRNRALRIVPVVELVGWHVVNGFQTQPPSPGVLPAYDASGTDIVNLKFGGRVAFDSQNSVYAGWGHALTTASWYDDIFRIEYRFSF
jgi:hypothetical protein